jgi:hypothetical protein
MLMTNQYFIDFIDKVSNKSNIQNFHFISWSLYEGILYTYFSSRYNDACNILRPHSYDTIIIHVALHL